MDARQSQTGRPAQLQAVRVAGPGTGTGTGTGAAVRSVSVNQAGGPQRPVQTRPLLPTAPQGRVAAQTAARTQQAPSSPVIDTYHVSLCGLQHWYKDAVSHVGTLATMRDDNANRGSFERSLDQRLSQLHDAIRQRKKLIPDMSSDQAFDLNIMLSHVVQLKTSLTRLASGR